MRIKTFIAAAVVGLLASTAVANAQQPQCFKRDKLVEFLNNKHGEYLSGFGLTPSGQALEVFTSDDGGWTVITTTPTGISCVRASGDNWNDVDRGTLQEEQKQSS